jgi:copper chaperone NosL
MNNKSRFALGLASVLLIGVFFTPLWTITLEAPQYPEGIGMYIHIDNVTGHKPNDLRNINGLNHYIGMKEIVPESIPELRIMPWLMAGLIALGLLAAATGIRSLGYAWVILFVLLLIVGLVDFYMWEYDYGHDLNPKAAIRIPGMAYQPPLIGSKKLLNFNASSWPALGGWIAFVSLVLGAYGVLRDRKASKAS